MREKVVTKVIKWMFKYHFSMRNQHKKGFTLIHLKYYI